MRLASLTNTRMRTIYTCTDPKMDLGAENGSDLSRNFACARKIAGLKRDGSDARMAAAAKLLRHRRQILVGAGLIPRIRPQADLCAHRRRAHADRIDALRMQQVRNELVVAFQIQIAHIKKDYVVARLCALAKNVNRAAMALEQRAQVFCHQRQLDHFRERAIRQLRNYEHGQSVLRGGFNHIRKLRLRLIDLYTLLT